MRITRDRFLRLLKLAVIHSAPVGNSSHIETFCLLTDLTQLDSDIVPESTNENHFWSSRWKLENKNSRNFGFPILCVQPVSENIEHIGKYNVDRRTKYRIYFLDQLAKAAPGEDLQSSHDIQNDMSIQASRLFRLFTTAVAANVIENPGDEAKEVISFTPILEILKEDNFIQSYTINSTSKALAKQLVSATSVAQGGYVDMYTKHNLYGVVYEFDLLECMEDDFNLMPNELCCK